MGCCSEMERVEDLMLMFGLSNIIDQLAAVNCTLVWSCVDEVG